MAVFVEKKIIKRAGKIIVMRHVRTGPPNRVGTQKRLEPRAQAQKPAHPPDAKTIPAHVDDRKGQEPIKIVPLDFESAIHIRFAHRKIGVFYQLGGKVLIADPDRDCGLSAGAIRPRAAVV